MRLYAHIYHDICIYSHTHIYGYMFMYVRVCMYIYIYKCKYSAPDIYFKILNMVVYVKYVETGKCVCIYVCLNIHLHTVPHTELDTIWHRNAPSQTTRSVTHTQCKSVRHTFIFLKSILVNNYGCAYMYIYIYIHIRCAP